MKIGVKIFSEAKFANHFKNKADFLEVMAIQGTDYGFLKNYPLPIVIHAEHQKFNVNACDKSKFNINKKSADFATNLADKLNAKKIIMHPGRLENKNCSIENSINFFRDLKDKRIIIENLPKYNMGFEFGCSTPKETREFVKSANKGFCFDINHAISTSLVLKEDYLKSIREFLKLAPVHYHLGGQKIAKGDISHLSFSESDINLKEIIKLIPKNAEITLETENRIDKTEKDLKIIDELN